MLRTLLWLALGTAVGAAVAYGMLAGHDGAFLTGPRVLGASATAERADPAAVPAQAGAALPTTIRVSERSAIYAEAARTSSPRAIQALLESTLTSPPSRERDFRLETLLRRFAEIDAARAVASATELGVETRLLLPVYQIWAESEPDAALAALGSVADAAAARAIGLSLLDVIGDDEYGMALVLGTLPNANESTFRTEALAEKAETAPYTALQEALALDDPVTRSRAVRRVATAWARRDPEAALSQLYVVSDPDLRTRFQANVLTQWASLDPDAALVYLNGELDSQGVNQARASFGALQVIAEEDPFSVLDMADGLPPELRTRAKQIALNTLAQRDPTQALTHVETLPQGQEREQLMQTIASRYAREDPDAALAWARNLQPRSAEITTAVLGGIAELDPDRALSLALQSTSQTEQQRALQSVVMRAAMRGNGQVMANRLVMLEDAVVRDQALQMLTQMWASRNAEEAFNWVLANHERAGRGMFNEIAERLGQQDPARAASYTNQIPPQFRETWIGRVADGYARVDPAGALSWIGQFQGQPGHQRALAAVAQHSAASDPQQAAMLLDSVDLASQTASQAAATVARRWAEQSPDAAAQWAINIEDDRARASAVSRVAAAWGRQSPATARAWVFNLASGQTRDAALGALVESLATTSFPDGALLDAFSTDQARQEGLRSAIYPLAARDPSQARALIDTYLTDPTLREQAEQTLENVMERGSFPNRFYFR